VIVAMSVTVTDVSKSFRQGEAQVNVLKQVTLTVEPGEIVSVMGKSGSGKTTLLDILGGIQRPDAGTVSVDDTELTAISESERTRFRRRWIGMVFQFFNLIPSLTALENVQFPLRINDLEVDNRAEQLLDELGMGDRLNQFPSTLSGGEKQRVAIARALVHDPVLVLADEPTGNLDYDHADSVLSSFRRLAKQQDVCLVMGTHSEECARYSDRVFNLRNGTLSLRE
jgi:putative ABC transport system ATP-binding protein